MFFYAKSVKQTNVKPLSADELVNKIKTSQTLKNLVEKTRKITDKRKRNDFKRQNLPIFVWANFKNKQRGLANFISTEIIGFDFDGSSVENAKKFLDKIKEDPRTFIAFISPSGTGVKVFFRLNTAIKDPQLYKTIFDRFASEFQSGDYCLEFDTQVSDVSRASFFSYDPNIYYNPYSVPIEVSHFDIRPQEEEFASAPDKYNYSEFGFNDTIEILKSLGYVIFKEFPDKVHLAREGNDHPAMTVFRSIDNEDGTPGRVGVYMFSTSDYRLPSSEQRELRGLPATYSPFELLMMFRFENDDEAYRYLEDLGFLREEKGKVYTIKRILSPIYRFRYDIVSLKLYVSKYGRPYELFTNVHDAEIRSLLAERIKNYKEIYKDVILSRMAEKVDPIKNAVDFLRTYPQLDPEYNPIKELAEQLEINYSVLTLPLSVEEEQYLMNIEDDFTREQEKFRLQREKVDAYVQMGLEKWFMSTVASWTKPDTVNEIVLVLQSIEQGIGKTRFIRSLYPSFLPKEYYNEHFIMGAFDKDVLLNILGSFMINIDEINELKGHALDTFKRLITSTEITVRPPYATVTETKRKYTFFAGTTNSPTFLSDKTGNRRFFVIPVTAVNYMHNINVDECYVWAYQQLQKGAQHWFGREEIEQINTANTSYIWDTRYEGDISRFFEKGDGVELQLKDIYHWIYGDYPKDDKTLNKFFISLVGMRFPYRRSDVYGDYVFTLKPKKPPLLWEQKDYHLSEPSIIVYSNYIKDGNTDNSTMGF